MKRGNGNVRSVRNFWLDGKRSDGVEVQGFGPRGVDGQMNLILHVRDDGAVGERTIRINCEMAGDELLVTADQYISDSGRRRTIQLYRGKR